MDIKFSLLILICIIKEEQERIRKQKEANPANEASDDSDGMLNESVLIELPYFLRKLFDWLLDHHAVSYKVKHKKCKFYQLHFNSSFR